jgi:hypothetical protein
VPPPPAPPTHLVPIDDPLPAPASDQLIVELRVIQSLTPAVGVTLPSTLPSDGVMLTRLRTLATLDQPFASDACVQETSVRLSGTIMQLDGRRYRASLSFAERFGTRMRQLTSRIELPVGEQRVLGGLMSAQGQDLLVVTLHRAPLPPG